MNRIFAVSLIAVSFFLGTAAVFAASPEELLAQVDSHRYIPDLSFVLQMTSFDKDAQVESNTLWGFISGVGTQNRSLIAFADPASVKGRRMLMDGNIVYLLFPRTTNPIRLSPLQVLLGQASNGDVERTGFSQDYDVTSLADADRDGVACYRFDLSVKAGSKDASYARVVLWVEKETLRPTYAEFFAGDKLLKKAFYKEYTQALGKDIPFVVDIYDGDNPQKHTVMEYKKVGQKHVPATVFRRDYLPSWTPEQPR